ncbi:MAG: YdcH family protein [Oricola sp.]
MSDQDGADVRLAYARLKQEHADYDAAIDAMIQVGCNMMQVQRMKKKKLAIKDMLQKLEDQIIPDIIA